MAVIDPGDNTISLVPGEDTSFGTTLPTSPNVGSQHLYTGGDLEGIIVEYDGSTWNYVSQARNPILAAELTTGDAAYTSIVATLPVGGEYEYQVFRNGRYETDIIFQNGTILRNSLLGSTTGATTFVELTDTVSTLSGLSGQFFTTDGNTVFAQTINSSGNNFSLSGYTINNPTPFYVIEGDGSDTLQDLSRALGQLITDLQSI